MRIFLLVLLTLGMLCGCAQTAPPDYLAYQSQAMTVEADFTLNGETFPGTLTLAAAAFDEAGRMLARDAALTIDGSIISGVTFEITGGEACISSGVLRIPLADESVVTGIRALISLFCIDPAAYHSAEPEGDLTRVTYTDGDNRVVMLWNPETELPTAITAEIDGKTIAAEISNIRNSA